MNNKIIKRSSVSLIIIVVAIALYLLLFQAKGDILGTVRYEPNSCIAAGVGCLEAYIELENRTCSIDVENAQKYKDRRVRVDGQIETTNIGIEWCSVNIKSIRGL